MFFSKVLPLQNWRGFGASWKRRAVLFPLPFWLYVPPSLMISISFSFISCGLCLLLLIILFPLESAITLSFCTRVFFSVQPVEDSRALSSPLPAISSSPPYSEGTGWIGKLCCVRDTYVGARPVGCCTEVLAPSPNPGRFSNASR